VINNVQQCSYPGKTTSNQTSTYTYNDASFPKSVTNTVAGVKEFITVVYK
jgi:YD repeat-containing protein